MLSRFFSLTSYASEDDIKSILIKKERYLDFACYAYHDKDDNENHYHILIQLKRPREMDEIKRWFDNCVDDVGKPVNTFIELTKDTQYMYDYLTHKNEFDVK